MIDIIAEKKYKPAVTRSKEPPAPEVPSVVIVPDKYYAIRADIIDFKDGFCIVKAKEVLSGSFVGVYMEKNELQNEVSTFCFEESSEIGHFDFFTIVSEVISANKKITMYTLM